MTPPTKKLLPRPYKSQVSILLWVDFLSLSANKTRYLHWSKSRLVAKEAKEAWLSSLRSSDAALKSLMTITSRLHSRACEMLLPQALVLTMVTGDSSGSTGNAQAEAGKEPSSKSTADNAQNPS